MTQPSRGVSSLWAMYGYDQSAGTQRGDNPGFLAQHNTQQPVIPMFTSLKELRRYAGKESKYFVITGAEVIDLLPTGYGFVLDMEGEHRMVFDAKAVEQMVEFAMRRMYG